MIDAGYNYPRLEEDSEQLFKDETIYLSEKENEYLDGTRRRKVFWKIYPLPKVSILNSKTLLKDPTAPYDGYNEEEDTKEGTRSIPLIV